MSHDNDQQDLAHGPPLAVLDSGREAARLDKLTVASTLWAMTMTGKISPGVVHSLCLAAAAKLCEVNERNVISALWTMATTSRVCPMSRCWAAAATLSDFTKQLVTGTLRTMATTSRVRSRFSTRWAGQR